MLKVILDQIPEEYMERERPEYEILLSGKDISALLIAIAVLEAEESK